MEIHQYWTVPILSQRMTTPSFAKKWRLQYNRWRKESLLKLTTSQQNWSKKMDVTRECINSVLGHLFHDNLQQDLADGRMANPENPVLSHHTSQERQPTCSSARTTEQSASSATLATSVMLKIILNRLKPQAEKIIAEEQAGFRAGRSTTEQIFNLRILCEKYLQH